MKKRLNAAAMTLGASVHARGEEPVVVRLNHALDALPRMSQSGA